MPVLHEGDSLSHGGPGEDQAGDLGLGDGPLQGLRDLPHFVTVDLPAAEQAVLEEGDAVVVILPDDTEVTGRVVFKAETASISPQGDATFEVVVELDDVAAAAGLDQAPVDVEVITDRADGVMAVPVTALVALAEGGYAVEVEQPDGTTRLVAVDPGLYADGWVEVDADGLAPGDRVVAP